MDERYEEKKKDLMNTLKGETNQEKIEDIDNRIFMIQMAEHLDNESYRFINMLLEIKRELEKENK